MAMVIAFAAELIAKKVPAENVREYVLQFTLKVRGYIPPKKKRPEDKDFNAEGLAFGTPAILFTQ
jgi:hypothetical protein